MKKKYVLMVVLATLFNWYVSYSQCAQVAPYTENFELSAGSTPSCWTESGGEDWDYDNSPVGYIGDNGDFMGTTSLSGGYYTWIDDSGSQAPSTLISPDIDISGLAVPALEFYMLSQVDAGDPNAVLDVEIYDGSTWTLLQSYSGNTGGWIQQVIDVSSYSGVVQVRFTITDSGSYYDDIAIDDISLKEMTTCFNPNSLGVSNVDDSSAEISWVAGNGETSFDIELVQSGVSPSGVATDSGVTSPYLKTGLAAQQGYEFYVQADCGSGDVSDWFGPFYFETACSVITAPYSEDFEAAGSLPDCWDSDSPSSRVWEFDTSPSSSNSYNDHTSGSGYFAYVDASSSYSTGVTMFSPFIDISNLNLPVLEFYVHHYVNGSSGSNSITVDVWDGAAWNQVYYDDDGDVNDWERVLVGFSSLNITGDVQLRFVVDTDLGSNFYNDIAIDDVSVDEAPPCMDPVNVTVENITSYSADIVFEDGNVIPVTQYNIEYGSPGFTPGAGTVVNASSNPYTLSNLTDATNYEFYIQTECSANDISAWVGPFAFETFVDCSLFSLDITNTTGDSVCGGGSVMLDATASGVGSDIYWYASETGDDLLGLGGVFSPDVSSTTSFWVSEVLTAEEQVSGIGYTNWDYTGSTSTADNYRRGLYFNATNNFVINTVDVYDASSSGGTMNVELYNTDTDQLIESAVVSLPGGGSSSSPVQVTLTLDFLVPSPGNYRLVANDSPVMKYEYDYGENFYPMAIGNSGEILQGGYSYVSTSTGTKYEYTYDWYYNYFYNWSITESEVQCESTRQEVIATVNDVADEEVLTLPYTQAETTTNYGNNYGGESGGCSGGNYLNSSDVVYHYQATDDYIMTVEMSGLTAQGSSVFVYESCADIGSNCIAGEVNRGALDYSFSFSVVTGQDYYVVVSGNGDDYDYTIDMYGETCANYSGPNLVSPQDFLSGQTLFDLKVQGANLSWYSDAAATVPVVGTTPLVDGTTYYVSRTFEGCESSVTPITVNLGDCNSLGILSTTGADFCDEDSVVLTAEAAGVIGQEVNWYSAQNGNLLLGDGEEFVTPVVNETTSYWVSEVAYRTIPSVSNQGYVYDSSVSTYSSSSNYGLTLSLYNPMEILDVKVYSSSSAGGELELEILDNSTDEVVESIMAMMPSGGSSSTPIEVTIPVNVFLAPGNYKIIKVSGPTLMYTSSSSASYPYPLGNSGDVTSGATASGTTSSHYFFYDFTIREKEIVCQSIPIEVVANRLGLPIAPYGNTGQTVCSGSTLADLVVDGEDIVWYDEETEGNPLDLTTVLENGEFYYASQTINGCESDARIDVLVTVTNTPSDLPVANATQVFDYGDTLDDLMVEGENLTWYADAQGANVITDNTQLVDGETYYVSQTIGAQCESDLLAITVEETLSVSNYRISGLSMYPNPAKNQLTIEYANRIEDVQVFDLLGKKVIHQRSLNGSASKIDVSHLAAGAYVVRITVASGVGVYKLIKE